MFKETLKFWSIHNWNKSENFICVFLQCFKTNFHVKSQQTLDPACPFPSAKAVSMSSAYPGESTAQSLLHWGTIRSHLKLLNSPNSALSPQTFPLTGMRSELETWDRHLQRIRKPSKGYGSLQKHVLLPADWADLRYEVGVRAQSETR